MATVMELLHTATLLHDDIIDGAEMRSGRRAVSAQWGNDTAVLMGDWIYMSAFETALRQRNLEILDTLTEATRKMTEGELIQLTLIGNIRITEDQHLNIVRRKTGFLFSSSCRVGGILRGASDTERAALADYGMSLGIAFQLTDDLLDFTSDSEKLGKPVLSDLKEGKLTLPLIRLLVSHPEFGPTVREAMDEEPGQTVLSGKVLELLAEYGELDRARRDANSMLSGRGLPLSILPDNQYRRASGRHRPICSRPRPLNHVDPGDINRVTTLQRALFDFRQERRRIQHRIDELEQEIDQTFRQRDQYDLLIERMKKRSGCAVTSSSPPRKSDHAAPTSRPYQHQSSQPASSYSATSRRESLIAGSVLRHRSGNRGSRAIRSRKQCSFC
jgi:octaprenyl-diphosphate synthase